MKIVVKDAVVKDVAVKVVVKAAAKDDFAA